MYFSTAQIVKSIGKLGNVHTFHGITFLVCKQLDLPVGQKTEIQLDAETKKFMEAHHRLAPDSDFYFQPFASSDQKKKWIRPDYPSSGLQAVNTQTFNTAFLHDRNTRLWGWRNNYVDVLSSKLRKQSKVPAFDLAVWIYREIEWPEQTNLPDVIAKFVDDYRISAEERVKLFDQSTPKDQAPVFQITKATWKDLRGSLPSPPDAKPDEGGTLKFLETRGLGPADRLVFQPATRLTLITGDNGLGKSFLLDAAWWGLTGTWPAQPAYPNLSEKKRAEITFSIEGENAPAQQETVSFNWRTLKWNEQHKRSIVPGLLVYARVDGSFAVWDPSRRITSADSQERTEKITLSSQDVWDGKTGKIEGLIRDWVKWQRTPESEEFEALKIVLAKLSPSDLGELRPGEPIRVPEDVRDIPTVVHPYGSIPLLHASAGVKRVVILAYLIVWTWYEHRVASKMISVRPQRRMVVLIDEIEAHLHPRWQRSILPSLISLDKTLSSDLEAQFIVATHSPLVMASSEPIFDRTIDKLYHLELDSALHTVGLLQIEYEKFGDVSAWLTSPVFELRHARSAEAESAIESAKQMQLSQENVDPQRIVEVTEQLKEHLSQTDRFWPRWIAFAERYGVDV
jgi:AAA domain, putative AbiEii toxin, Type IV TA system